MKADAHASLPVAVSRIDKRKTATPVPIQDDVRLAVQRLKRERIISAAMDQFEEHGFSQASLDAVAEQMGVTRPFIYTQFPSKTALLGEICSQAIRISLQSIDEALANSDGPRQQLEHFARELMLGALRSGKHLAIYMREEKNLSPADYQLVHDLRREVDAKLVDVLRRGIAQGEFEIDDPKIAAIAIGGIATWVGVRLGRLTRYPPEQTAEQVVRLVMSLAGAKRPRASRKRPITA